MYVVSYLPSMNSNKLYFLASSQSFHITYINALYDIPVMFRVVEVLYVSTINNYYNPGPLTRLFLQAGQSSYSVLYSTQVLRGNKSRTDCSVDCVSYACHSQSTVYVHIWQGCNSCNQDGVLLDSVSEPSCLTFCC